MASALAERNMHMHDCGVFTGRRTRLVNDSFTRCTRLLSNTSLVIAHEPRLRATPRKRVVYEPRAPSSAVGMRTGISKRNAQTATSADQQRGDLGLCQTHDASAAINRCPEGPKRGTLATPCSVVKFIKLKIGVPTSAAYCISLVELAI